MPEERQEVTRCLRTEQISTGTIRVRKNTGSLPKSRDNTAGQSCCSSAHHAIMHNVQCAHEKQAEGFPP